MMLMKLCFLLIVLAAVAHASPLFGRRIRQMNQQIQQQQQQIQQQQAQLNKPKTANPNSNTAQIKDAVQQILANQQTANDPQNQQIIDLLNQLNSGLSG